MFRGLDFLHKIDDFLHKIDITTELSDSDFLHLHKGSYDAVPRI